jgi:hypothetical protein
MSKYNFTAEQLREVVEYYPDTGYFFSKARRGNQAAFCRCGTLHKNGYRLISVFGTRVWEHRLVWFYIHGEWPKHHIDHINGNPSDNRIENLRDVTRSVNLQNRQGPTKANKSGFLGVIARGNKWRARIKVGGKGKYIGTFDTKELAHSAYLAYKRLHHDGCSI